MELNEIVKATCVDLNHEGLGVCKIDGFPIFVNDLLVNEVATIKITKLNNNYGNGVIVKRISDSSLRTRPICKNFGVCGGCDLMHMTYPAQLQFKLKMVNETLKRIGHIDYEIKEIIEANNPYQYRNKVQIPYTYDGKKNIYGFYKKKSHELVEFDDCIIGTKETSDIAKFVKNIFNEYKIPCYDEQKDSGVLRNLLVRKTYDNNYMVVLVSKVKTFNHLDDIVLKIKNRYSYVKSIILNFNPKKNNTILGDEYKVLYGEDYLIEDILGLKFKMSHKAFFQINHEQTEKLYSKALEFSGVTSSSTVLDVYCGVGTISLCFAKIAKKVIGIEVVEKAINNAKDNYKLNIDKLNSKDVEFICGKAEDLIESKLSNDIGILVCDPPRKGLDIKVSNAILNSNIKKFIYVSCDPATLARDLEILTKNYAIKNSCCVDLFPNTCNVETVIELERK